MVDLKNEQAVSDRVSQILLNRPESIEDIAQATGISLSTLYRWRKNEKRSNQMDLQLLNCFANFIDEDITIFLGEEKHKKKIKLTEDEATVLALYRECSCKNQNALISLFKGISEHSFELEIKVATEAQKINENGIKRLLELCDDLQCSGKYQKEV